MLSHALGFNILGEPDRRLRIGLMWGVATAAAETITYAALCVLLVRLFTGTTAASDVTAAALVFGALTILLIWLRARAYTETFAVSYASVAAARLRLADHLSRLPAHVLTKDRNEVIAELLTVRFQLYQDVAIHVWGLAVANAALPVFLWGLLVVLDWRLAVMAAILVPVAFLAIPWSHRLLTRASKRLAKTRNMAIGGVVDQIDGLREFRQFDPEGRRFDKARDAIDAFKDGQMKLELAAAPALLLFAFILLMGLGAVAVSGVVLLLDGTIAAASLIVFLIVAQRFFRGIGDLGVNMAELRFARDVLEEIRALSEEPTLPEPETGVAPRDNAIAFEEVCADYGDGLVVKHVSGHVPAGSMLALVGMSGSGKSTLAGLVARLQDVSGGALRIGGADVRDMTIETLSSHVSMVLQHVVLFEGTIADNIRLGRPDAADDDVVKAARAAQAHDFISALPEGYATTIAASGDILSGGERQRIAVARALLKDAPILILDEATSSIDLPGEERIQTALSKLTRGRTVIVIAHRLWTVKGVDQIWVLDDGCVVQRGTHAELLAEEGRYKALWDAQVAARAWRIVENRVPVSGQPRVKPAIKEGF